MIKKIISGGQTGADRAALDLAIEMAIPHGGWVPKGRKAEDGKLPPKYHVREMHSANYALRTEQNVIDSDGTLILSHGDLTDGSDYTRQMAQKHTKPCLHVDLKQASAFNAAQQIADWIKAVPIEVLNVAGPRASKDPQIYNAVKNILEAVCYLNMIKDGRAGFIRTPDSREKSTLPAHPPRNVNEAVQRLASELSLKDCTTIANMSISELPSLFPSLGRYIKDKFGLWAGNTDLMTACQFTSKKSDLNEDDACRLIIRHLWDKLRQTHKLRVIK